LKDKTTLALRDFIVTPDFKAVPKDTWEHVPGIQDSLQESIDYLRSRFPDNPKEVLDYLNNKSTLDVELQRIRDLEIENAAKEGRIAKILQGNRYNLS
jgi:hypothetical protein